MALETEMKTYNENIGKWSDQTGKYVLIKGEQVIDFFVAYEDALKAGYQKFQLEPFLVKQVNTVATVQHITRHIFPSATVHA